MINNVKDLRAAYGEGQSIEFVFFWRPTPSADGKISESCLSQWWDCRFEVDGVEYCCADFWVEARSYCCMEQFMMAEKARLFDDGEMLTKIMESVNPKEMKAYGRKVRGFEKDVWEDACYGIVKRGNVAKFSQNPELWEYLKRTQKRILVEASPMDRIWGIGMGKTNPDAQNPLKWKGSNLLGFALTEVREQLLKAEMG